jgi:zinc/manganese transport system permease protein
VPQEAIIGIVYAVSAAAAMLVVDRAPQGSEHIKQLLVGSILTVTPAEVGALALLYAPIGVLHWLVRRPLLDISFDPDGAGARRAVRRWDFVFYASFGVVVTSSVRLAGVLLVFAYLVVPATVVVAFAVALAGLAVGLAARAGARATRERGVDALRGAAIGLCAAVGIAGLLLLLAPRMDHWWLDWLEATIPGVRSLFLNGDERDLHRDSVEGAQRSVAELERVRSMQREVQWGARQVSEDMQERMRQYLAGRAELLAGDRMVLGTLRARARERQRWWIGVPLVVLGAGGAGVLVRRRRATSRCSGRSPCRSSARAARP